MHSLQTGGLAGRLAEDAGHATDSLARQGAFEAYTALIAAIGAPVEPFVALVLSTILDKCSDKVGAPSAQHNCIVVEALLLLAFAQEVLVAADD